MSDPSCHDLIKASGNFIARCFEEPIGCVADDRIDCENGCMLKLAYKAGKDEQAALIERLQQELKEAREIIEEVKNDRDQFRRDIIQLQYGVFIALGELEKGDNRDIEVDPIDPLAILRDSMSFGLKKMADERKAIRSKEARAQIIGDDVHYEEAKRLHDQVASIRAKTIEECAKVADQKAAEIKYIYDDRIAVATDIAKAIRSIDGGGKP